MITRDQAVVIARRELTKHGYDLSTIEITPEDTPSDEFWMIVFKKRGAFPVPGGHGVVQVNITTGEAELLRGE